MDALASRSYGFFGIFALERMVEPKFGLRAFQVSLSTPTLSVHSTVGSGASSCNRRTSTMGATIPLFIS